MSDLTTSFSRVSVPNTYLPTTDSNSESISTILTERQQQLDVVSCEISGLETVMDDIKNLRQQLVERKEKINQSMTFHKGLRSALWCLPTEVLCQIFHHCLREDKDLLPISNLTPMLLTRICRPWREVAVDMPSLWCRFHVEFNVTTVRQQDFVFHRNDDDDYYYYRRLEKGSDVEVDHRAWQQAVFHYNLWLKRSRGRPLSIALMRYDSTVLLGNLLQPYMDQISFLSIYFSRRFGAGKPQLLLKDMPALRELVILVDDRHIPPMEEYISQLPSTIHILDVMDLPFDIRHLSSLDPAWTHLTQVKISFFDQYAFLHLLRLCPNLSSLTVEIQYDIFSRLREETDVDRQQALEPFTHTNLQTLCLGYADEGALLARLFNALSLPSLRVFHACACNTRKIRQWPHKRMIDLIARSNCPLERLSFCGFTGMNVRRAKYVALIPSLDVVENVVCQWPWNSTETNDNC
ncbi:uncharacterized protein HD556DRAFT_1414881 [Suillus plorans]|uniref:F-box domain-containing protein n=1 Tax=Suillus plorans TaxID=116603 RepID=A0A9P7DBW8_9AGAM|nr:uncharacterized protein HD556DRAFT_1414881 [Suillus plorans]KAG1786560.1 hypothetical protein HD556DRAFT_1414881 [Suillus plorans]